MLATPAVFVFHNSPYALTVTKVFPKCLTHNLKCLFQRCALSGMVPQFNQPATCLLRKTTGSICSAAGC